ncbi:MAG TPA: efflux RND transporter periplasmic adaptor subunit [Micropepsaceae bacterium]|nr:efflux RND transporter periplasmic adaptor subunit [Micropepsaceae bacterium]
MFNKSMVVAAVLALAGVALVAITLPFLTATPEEARLEWEAINAEIREGKDVHLAIRLVGAGDVPGPATLLSARLDMGPDGMAGMEAPLDPVPVQVGGVLIFRADLTMAGRWSLAVSAAVEGRSEPVNGNVIFTVHPANAAPPAGERAIIYYRNPMGLADISIAPKLDSMGMNYIPVYADELAGPEGAVTLSPVKIQLAGVRTARVERRELSRLVRAAGTVAPDEARLAVTAVKFDGFIEELLVTSTGSSVRAGQPLMRVWIESREILERQIDYVLALRGTGSLADAERNLRQFGISDEVMAQIREAKRPVRSIVLTAPLDGTVLEKPAVAGMRFAAGEPLFRTADLTTVWVLAEVSERDLGLLREGQTARISPASLPGEEFSGQVAFIYPVLDMEMRTARVRIVVSNDDMRLRIGQFAEVLIEVRVGEGPVLVVPTGAVIDTGARQIVFIAREGGVFEPRDVTIGIRGGEFTEIREGLTEGDQIVVAGNFLIDAESNLRAALGTFGAGEARP